MTDQPAATFPARAAIASRRITVKEVAQRAGRSEFTTGRSLNGYCEPHEEVIAACEELTGLDRDELFPVDHPTVSRVLAQLVKASRAVQK